MSDQANKRDRTAIVAEAFYMANLLFTGFVYIALLVLYFKRYKKDSQVAKFHLKQTLLAATFTTTIFLLINLYLIVTDSYASVTGLIMLETYYMAIVPICFIPGIIGLTKGLKGEVYRFPLIGRLIS